MTSISIPIHVKLVSFTRLNNKSSVLALLPTVTKASGNHDRHHNDFLKVNSGFNVQLSNSQLREWGEFEPRPLINSWSWAGCSNHFVMVHKMGMWRSVSPETQIWWALFSVAKQKRQLRQSFSLQKFWHSEI